MMPIRLTIYHLVFSLARKAVIDLSPSSTYSAALCFCIVDGTGGGMIQTPDDHQFQRSSHRARNSGLFGIHPSNVTDRQTTDCATDKWVAIGEIACARLLKQHKQDT